MVYLIGMVVAIKCSLLISFQKMATTFLFASNECTHVEV
jgi:hypothetical protein